jgi:hypothetical protein
MVIIGAIIIKLRRRLRRGRSIGEISFRLDRSIILGDLKA